ncbi:hypothetical protein JMUB7507_26530 [Staphylococcus aureus]
MIGTFLNSDLFNFYVVFEIMLPPSFVLNTLGHSVALVRAVIISVFFNIFGSWLFLFRIVLLYYTV